MMMASLKNSSGSMNFHYRTIGALSSKLQRNTQRKCYHQETKTTLLEENNATNNSEKALSPKKEASFGVALYEKVFQFWKESSGTDEILILKEKVIDASRKFDIITQQVSNARRDVDVKFLQYQEVSKEHSSMLQSKDRWSPQDAQKFADLISDEIGRRKAWEEACEVLKISEERQGTIQVEYMDSMRKRYHEEQVWQEKWRILATYSTFALIFLNSSVFLISQIIHYKREAERFKAIESLIEEKIQSISAVASSEMKELDNKKTSPIEPEEDGIEEIDNKDKKITPENGYRKNEPSPIDETIPIRLRSSYFSMLHVPSALVGAVASCTAFIIVSSISKRQP